MPKALTAIAIATFTLTSPAHGQAPVADAQQSVDSLTLVRTTCLGPCPAYRLDISATGLVHFVSQHPSTAGRTSTQASSPDMVQRIERVLVAHDFRSLPDIVTGQLPYCGVVATDHPTITVTIFAQGTHVSKSYYTGCHGSGHGDTLPLRYINALRIIADSIAAIASPRYGVDTSLTSLARDTRRPANRQFPSPPTRPRR